MIGIDRNVAASGKKIYDELAPTLKEAYPSQYIAIEPVSGEYYIAPTSGSAIARGKAIYPNRQFYTTGIDQPMHVPIR